MEDMKTVDFKTAVEESSTPVVVDFYAPWCGYCKRLAPLLTVLEKTYDGKVKFVKVNVDDEKELEERFQIMTLPTLMFFKDGKASDGLVNHASKTVITGWLAEKGIE